MYAPKSKESACERIIRRRCQADATAAASGSTAACQVCAGHAQAELRRANCSKASIDSLCQSPPPPPFAVVVYIHSGGFTWGGSDDRESDGVAMHATPGWNETVLVTLNYRLGYMIFTS